MVIKFKFTLPAKTNFDDLIVDNIEKLQSQGTYFMNDPYI